MWENVSETFFASENVFETFFWRALDKSFVSKIWPRIFQFLVRQKKGQRQGFEHRKLISGSLPEDKSSIMRGHLKAKPDAKVVQLALTLGTL